MSHNAYGTPAHNPVEAPAFSQTKDVVQRITLKILHFVLLVTDRAAALAIALTCPVLFQSDDTPACQNVHM